MATAARLTSVRLYTPCRWNAIPSVTLTVLALSSFLIHVESGESIGFVTTILLAKTVFLLVIPSYLAVTSDGLPILGINLQITMIIIALVLFANIFVLRVYFMEGTPPNWTGKLCDFCSVKKSKRVKRIHVSQHDGAHPAIAKSTATMTSIETEASSGSPVLGKRVDDQEFTWRQMSIKMDQVFFCNTRYCFVHCVCRDFCNMTKHFVVVL